MSSPDQFQIPDQPYIPDEIDVSLHVSRLQPIEDANELNGARKDISDAFGQQSGELSPAERPYATISRISSALTDLRKKNDAA